MIEGQEVRRYDLLKCTFIIPLRIETADRMRNIITTLIYLTRNFACRIIVKEVDKESIYLRDVKPLLEQALEPEMLASIIHIFEESDEFKAALDKAIGNLRSIDVAEPAPEPAPAPAAAQRTGDNRTTQRADAVAARQAQLDAEFKASKKASAPTAAAKPKISIMRGRGGAQAQLQKAGVAGKDMGNILKGLRSDLSAAGFETLEEVMEAKRKTIKLDKTSLI